MTEVHLDDVHDVPVVVWSWIHKSCPSQALTSVVSPTLRKSLTPNMTCVTPELVEDLVVEIPLVELSESTLLADEPGKRQRTECVGDKHDKGLNAETDIWGALLNEAFVRVRSLEK